LSRSARGCSKRLDDEVTGRRSVIVCLSSRVKRGSPGRDASHSLGMT
jgi:hypothetical protein